MDRLREIQAVLADDARRAEITDEELAALEAELLELFDAIRQGDVEGVERTDTEVLREVADAVKGLRGEAERRIAAAVEAEEAIAAIEAELNPEEPAAETQPEEQPDGEGDQPAEPDEGDQPGEGDEPAGPNAPAEQQPAEATAEPEPVAVAAAARPALPSLGDMRARSPRVRVAARPRSGEPRLRNLVTGRDDDLSGIVRSMIEKRQDFGAMRPGIEEKIRVGRSTIAYPEETYLHEGDSPDAVMRKLDAVTAGAMDPEQWQDDAIVAAGGWCAPLPPDYEIMQISEAHRPVRDALPRVGGDRGGIRVMNPPDMSDVLTTGATTAAIGIWTNATDTTPGATIKGCQTVPCPTVTDVELQAIYRCLQFGNFKTRAFPELVRGWNLNTLAAHARIAEQELLDDIHANSTSVTTAQQLGAARDLLSMIAQLAAAERNRQRMRRDARLRVLMPAWVLELMQVDRLRQGNVELRIPAETEVRQWLATFGINVSFYEDSATGAGQVFAAQGAGNDLRDFPQTVVWYLYHEGAHVLIDQGELDLGLIRDADLVETNDYRTFAESFERVAFKGIFSYRVSSTVCATGAAQAAIDESDLCAAS